MITINDETEIKEKENPKAVKKFLFIIGFDGEHFKGS
jgi:hypothetical protein